MGLSAQKISQIFRTFSFNWDIDLADICLNNIEARYCNIPHMENIDKQGYNVNEITMTIPAVCTSCMQLIDKCFREKKAIWLHKIMFHTTLKQARGVHTCLGWIMI